MRHSQRGVTFIGWIILLVPVAIVVFAGIRLAPIYLNYFSVVKYMNLVASENREGGSSVTPSSLHYALEKTFGVGYVEQPDAKDIEIRRVDGGWIMIADYEETAPIFANVLLLASFHKEVPVR